MKKLFATATACVALLAAPAQAFTTWSNFEIDGYDVTARYHDGDLRYITAVNEETGDAFSARVGYNGVATVKRGGQVVRIDLDAAEERLFAKTTMDDLAAAK
ncbi:MAG: hypothetical protein AAGA36_04810 [Pseudomonadota bacterium]